MAYEPEGCLTSIVIQLGITLLGLFALLVLYGVVSWCFGTPMGLSCPTRSISFRPECCTAGVLDRSRRSAKEGGGGGGAQAVSARPKPAAWSAA